MTTNTLERRNLRFLNWEGVLSDVEALKSSGYDHAKRGNLSLGQICNHLAIVMEGAMDGFPTTMPWPMRKMLRLFFLKSMLQHKPSGMRIPAPAFARQSAPVDDETGVERLRAAIERFAKPNAIYVMHPAFGDLTREQWRHQQLWHCEHHLSFLVPRDRSLIEDGIAGH